MLQESQTAGKHQTVTITKSPMACNDANEIILKRRGAEQFAGGAPLFRVAMQSVEGRCNEVHICLPSLRPLRASSS